MTTLRGKIALGILLGLYVIFLVFVASLIIRNKRRARRRRKLAPAASGYKHLSSDVELGSLDQQQQDTEVGIAQLPTDREGGEDLESRPHLQIELENTEVRPSSLHLKRHYLT